MDETLADRDLQDWLRLVHIQGVTPGIIRKLLRHFGTPAGILRATAGDVAAAGVDRSVHNHLRNINREGVLADCHWLESSNHHFVSCLHPCYPERLVEISHPPLGLYVRGDPAALAGVHLAVIGTRKPTPAGTSTAVEFARALAAHGIVVTSGLAEGIDRHAHVGALQGKGLTVAVLSCGADRVYPGVNRSLAEQIADQGCLASEFPVGTPPKKGNFPRRNRIISGLSVGTLVIEAAEKSGSMITARYAIEQGREVFAIPGSIRSPVSAGCHSLIRDGAKLTAKVEDILEEIELPSGCRFITDDSLVQPTQENEILDEAGKLLLDSIGYEPVTVDQIVEFTGTSASVVAAILLNLEFKNLVNSMPGGRYVRK